MYVTPPYALSLMYLALSIYPHIYYKNKNSSMQMFGVAGPVHVKRGAMLTPRFLTRALEKIYKRLQLQHRGLARASWDHTKHGADWSEIYPQCGGQRQSPIDIVEEEVSNDDFAPLTFEHYSDNHPKFNIINNGHTVDAVGPWGSTGDDIPTMSGGPLQGTYQLAGVHFHWGHDHLQGSEHTINGVPGVLEIHFVHVNTKYQNLSEAMASNDPEALAVVAILFALSQSTTEEAIPIFRTLEQVAANGNSIEFLPHFQLDLISYGDSYFTYQGSLTTPPCSESVRWIVMEKPLEISLEDLNIFKGFMKNGVPMAGIYRETQPLNGRKIQKSST